MIVVDSGASYWHPRRSSENRMKMLVEEIVTPAMRANNATREAVALIGWSMGAYGALLAAEMYPGLFGTVCATSVAIWRTAAEQHSAVPDAFDDAGDFARYDLRLRLANLRRTNVRMTCGQHDPFYRNDRALARDFAGAGVRAQVDFPSGCHDDAYWMRVAPADFAFLVKSIAS
jgi:enterochelin esterase-like enzyme